MNRMRDVLIDIQCDIEDGKLTFAQIAKKYDVPYKWVVDAYIMMQEFQHYNYCK